jgi:hypothetical protein
MRRWLLEGTQAYSTFDLMAYTNFFISILRFVRSVIRIFVIINVEMSPAQLKKKTLQSNLQVFID